MPAAVALSGDVLASEVLLGGQRIVRHAAQREIREHMATALRESLRMMDLETVRFSTALAAFVAVNCIW